MLYSQYSECEADVTSAHTPQSGNPVGLLGTAVVVVLSPYKLT